MNNCTLRKKCPNSNSLNSNSNQFYSVMNSFFKRVRHIRVLTFGNKKKALFQSACSSYVIFSFLNVCSGKKGNELLNNLILLGCLCKQRPLTVFSINKVFPLAQMSITQNLSGKKYVSNLKRGL